jgi:hypothetical protein
MENYGSLAEKALMQLHLLLNRGESPLTAWQLVQITTIFLYCVHNATVKSN